MTPTELVEAVYAASNGWATVPPAHPSYVLTEERVYTVTPASVGCYYGRTLSVCRLIVQGEDDKFSMMACFTSIDDGDVPILGPWESRKQALARAARFKEVFGMAYVPNIEEMLRLVNNEVGLYLNL